MFRLFICVLLACAVAPNSGCWQPAATGAKSVTDEPQKSQSKQVKRKARRQKPTKHHELANERSLADLLNEGEESATAGSDGQASLPAPLAPTNRSGVAPSEPAAVTVPPRLRAIDEEHAGAVGVRKLTGKHLVLFTDVPSDASVDELPQVFDQAFPQWCEFLGLDAAKYDAWQARAFLIRDRAKFEASGLCPVDLPKFLNGYTRGGELWLYDQTSEYYRRHLLLHEGTHSIMFTLQKSSGPAWYMEGLAELLATHRWQEGRLVLGYFPKSGSEVSKLGRLEIVRQAVENGSAMSFREVLDLENRNYSVNESYAWSWAATAFLAQHPRYRERFLGLMKTRARRDFNDRLRAAYAKDGRELAEEWISFTADLAYGYDFERTQLDFTPGRPLPADAPAKLTVAADRGWQNSGLRLEAGKTYRITARGRYQLATDPRPWISEPGGVTLRYYRGRPLGLLIAALRTEPAGPAVPEPRTLNPEPSSALSFVDPLAVGLEATVTPARSGTLYLRINDSPAELGDNAGQAEIEIEVE